MLVESVDGEYALLGRPRSLKRRGPVLTCLSGFIEQGESIEEAVSSASVSQALCTAHRVAGISGAFSLQHASQTLSQDARLDPAARRQCPTTGETDRKADQDFC